MNKLRSIIAITRLNRPIGIYLLIYPSLIAFIFASQLLTNAEIMTPKSLNILLYKSLAIIIICIITNGLSKGTSASSVKPLSKIFFVKFTNLS